MTVKLNIMLTIIFLTRFIWWLLNFKEYICFQTYYNIVWADQCSESMALFKVSETINIISLEHQFIIIKWVFKYEKLRQHRIIIDINQFLTDSALYKQRFYITPRSYTNIQVNFMTARSIMTSLNKP